MIILNLIGTEKGQFHPVHIHFDDIAGHGEIAAVLNPIDGATGNSTTSLEAFEDFTKSLMSNCWKWKPG